MPVDIRIRFGRAIRRIREEQEINQEEAAESYGLHRTCCSDAERGIRNASLVNIEHRQRAEEKPSGSVWSYLSRYSYPCPTFLPHYVLSREDVTYLKACGADPEVSRIEEEMRCKRPSGTERAWFLTREEAIAFSKANGNYHRDIPALCARCERYHLNQPEWLIPQRTHRDAHLLEQMDTAGTEKMPDDFKCAECGVPVRARIDFLILPDGAMICGANCMSQND